MCCPFRKYRSFPSHDFHSRHENFIIPSRVLSHTQAVGAIVAHPRCSAPRAICNLQQQHQISNFYTSSKAVYYRGYLAQRVPAETVYRRRFPGTTSSCERMSHLLRPRIAFHGRPLIPKSITSNCVRNERRRFSTRNQPSKSTASPQAEEPGWPMKVSSCVFL